MANHKGIGVNEVSEEFSFHAPCNSTDGTNRPWEWFKTTQEAVQGTRNYARAWDNDRVLIGHSTYPFVIRGGDCVDGSSAGVFASYVTGSVYHSDGFRSVLVV